MPEEYLAVADDPKSVQYGLPKYVCVDGEWIETAVYVARCKAPIKTDTKRTRPDGSPIYDVTRDAAQWDDELKKIVWPDDKVGSTAVFLGLPKFSRGLSYDKKTAEPITDSMSIEVDGLKLKMIYRDIQGKKATNCAVYVVE